MTEIETLERKKELKLQFIQLTRDDFKTIPWFADEIKTIDEFIIKLKREGKR